MREATNQSEELLLRDSTFTMQPQGNKELKDDEMVFLKEDGDGDLIDEEDSSDEAQDTVGPLSVRSTLFDEHLLPSNNKLGSTSN